MMPPESMEDTRLIYKNGIKIQQKVKELISEFEELTVEFTQLRKDMTSETDKRIADLVFEKLKIKEMKEIFDKHNEAD